MRRLRTIYYLTALAIFTVAVFIVFTFIWLATVPFDRNRAVQHRVSRFWSKGIYRLNPWWKVEVSGMEHVRCGEAYVVVSNHQAMLDIPLLYVLPFNFRWVSKREVYKIPIFGWVLRMHGDIAIERGGAASTRKMIKDCAAYLERGVSVIMFPEGTRTKTGRVNGFREGAMTVATEAGRRILPVVIDGTYDTFDKKGYIAAPHRFRVKVLPAVPSGSTDTKSLEELVRGEHRKMVSEQKRY